MAVMAVMAVAVFKTSEIIGDPRRNRNPAQSQFPQVWKARLSYTAGDLRCVQERVTTTIKDRKRITEQVLTVQSPATREI